MADLPIIFSGAMVRALLDGRKTMTRRLAWRKPFGVDGYDDIAAEDLWREGYKVSGPDDTEHRIVWPPSPWQKVKPGDRLWVRENWWHPEPYSYGTTPGGTEIECPRLVSKFAPVHFAADGNPPNVPNRHYATGLREGCGKFSAPDPYAIWTLRPSIHMPRWASRLTLIVEAVKVERLQDISEKDAWAEGVLNCGDSDRQRAEPGDGVVLFRSLWNSLHGDNAWAANPELVCLSFKVVKANIDQVKEAA